MTGALHVIGVDPGPIPGVVSLDYDDGRLARCEVVQCSASLLLPVVGLLIERAHGPVELAVERFVVGYRASRSSTPGAGQVARDQVGALIALHRPGHVRVTLRSMSEIKAWTTDTRLDMAGIAEHVKGMRHATAAARHALYCAVRDHGVPDPLSRTAIRHRSP